MRVWDIQDNEWSATIDNGSGGMGKIANAEFGADDTEVLVFAGFNAQVTVWSLWTGRSVEIKDPKFAAKGHGRNKNFALLSRPASHDVVTIHAPRSYGVLKTFNPPTSDAQGLQWSPNGKWLAIWDNASTGFKVLIYTADGNLYRTYTGDYFDDELQGLGVKTIEWSPNGDFLAIGGYENTITLLSTRTFCPAIHLAHTNIVSPSSSTIFTEHANPSSESGRAYTTANTSISPPTSNASSNERPAIGTSILAFNSTGSQLASRDDAHPTTVWIWDLAALRSRAVLVQHSVVKKVVWHPSDPDLLLIHCIQGENLLYVWDTKAESNGAPRILQIPTAARMSGKADARWLRSSGRTAILYGDANSSTVLWPDGREPVSPNWSSNSSVQSDDDDSLYKILSGNGDNDGQTEELPRDHISQIDFDTLNGSIQDTFDFRKGVSAY